jgi:acyl-CoA reductase-like NAD-dependent aldehyde dehydrogenase
MRLGPAVASAPAITAGSACAAARVAGTAWAARPLAARAAVLRTAARELATAAWLVDAIVSRTARPAHEVWSAELLPTIDALRWLGHSGSAALRPRRLPGSWLQWYVRSARHELHWDPLGVVGLVSPANSVLFLPVSQAAAALLGGNAVLWKPAPGGADIALAVLEIFRKSGLPSEVLQIVPGGAEAARAVVRAGIDKLLFTGSAGAGLALYRLQAETGRPAALELSGQHTAIVLADAPLAAAARGLVWAKLANGGRHCVSPQLVLVERPLAPGLTLALAEALGAAEPAASPVAEEDARRLRTLVADAVARGGRVVHRGPDGGLPALVAEVRPGMRVVDEEVQGAVLAVAAVDRAEQAVGWINGSACRLSASVWAGDVARARRLAAGLDVGQVWINDALHPAAQPAAPLAGRGRSGFGASRGWPGLLETVQPKVISVMPRWAPRLHHDRPRQATVRILAATARLAAARGWRPRLGAALALLRAGGALMGRGR